MNDELFVIGLVGALGVSTLALIVTIWMRSGKGTPGWLMAASTVGLVAGFGCVAWSVAGNPFGPRISDQGAKLLANLGIVGMCLAAVLFAAGFLLDRVRRSGEGQ